MAEQQKGIVNAVIAYLIWGLFPLFWMLLAHVNSLEILLGRVIWSFVFTTIFLLLIRQGSLLMHDIKALWTNKKQFWSLAAASVFIGLNWYIYIWAVTNNFVLQTSLGYYINPLISVLFGMLFFKEKMTRITCMAVLIAAIGVLIQTISYGEFPWIAILLALSFAFYSVLKKKITLDATRGLAIETLFLLPVALVYYAYLFVFGEPSLLHIDRKTDILLIISGIATAVPLVLFAKGARRIPFILLGFIQYLSPTIVLCLGVFLYDEPFTKIETIAFSCIWIAILIFTIGKIYESRSRYVE